MVLFNSSKENALLKTFSRAALPRLRGSDAVTDLLLSHTFETDAAATADTADSRVTAPHHEPTTFLSVRQSAIDWITGQAARQQMRRQVWLCVSASCLALVLVAVISSIVSLWLSHRITSAFGASPAESLSEFVSIASYTNFSQTPSASKWDLSTITPYLLVVISVCLSSLIALGLFTRRLPGMAGTLSAIDWATGCDGMARLLRSGCTYEESFRQVVQTMRRNYVAGWFSLAAERQQRGQTFFTQSQSWAADRDLAMLSAIIGGTHQDSPREDQTWHENDQTLSSQVHIPSSRPEAIAEQWATAAAHFQRVAERRYELLKYFLPAISTILAGLLAWTSIMSSLMSSWTVFEAIGGLR